MAGRSAILRVDIVADAGKATRGIDQAEGRFSKLGGRIGKVGAIAGGVLAGGLLAAGAAAVKLAQGAAEDEAAAARLARTLSNVTGATAAQTAAVEDWITKQGQALGVADDELRPALGRLATATGDVGKAQQLAALAMDVSAGTGKSLEAVSTALAKAQTGNVSGLARLGVATKDAAGNTLSLREVTAKLADTHRGQAATAADTTAGRFNRLRLRLAEAGETIGGKLLPVGEKLAGWALRMAPKVEQLAGELGRRLAPIFRTVSGIMREHVMPAARTVYSWFVEKIAPGLRRAVTPVLDGLRSAWGKVSEAIERNRPAIERLWDRLRPLAEFLANKVAPVVGKVLGGAFKVAGEAIGRVIDVIITLVDWIGTALEKLGWLIEKLRNIPKPDFTPWNRSAVAGVTAAGQLPAPGVTVVDARNLSTTVRVEADPLRDPADLARQLRRVLDDHARRIGAATAPSLPALGRVIAS